jgi:hypothetical protein
MLVVMVIDYATVRARLRWLAWPTLLSGALLVHFLISVVIWLVWFDGVFRSSQVRKELLPSLWSAVPAFALCGVCGAVFVLALRGRSVARRGALLVAVAAVALFCIDVSFGRWQIHTFVASKEYWDAGGRAHEYFTWWWYNDRWFG